MHNFKRIMRAAAFIIVVIVLMRAILYLPNQDTQDI